VFQARKEQLERAALREAEERAADLHAKQLDEVKQCGKFIQQPLMKHRWSLLSSGLGAGC